MKHGARKWQTHAFRRYRRTGHGKKILDAEENAQKDGVTKEIEKCSHGSTGETDWHAKTKPTFKTRVNRRKLKLCTWGISTTSEMLVSRMAMLACRSNLESIVSQSRRKTEWSYSWWKAKSQEKWAEKGRRKIGRVERERADDNICVLVSTSGKRPTDVCGGGEDEICPSVTMPSCWLVDRRGDRSSFLLTSDPHPV